MRANTFRIGIVAMLLATLMLSACAPASTTPTIVEKTVPETVVVEKQVVQTQVVEKTVEVPAGPVTNSIGKPLPVDAASPDQQVLRIMCDERKHLDVSGGYYDSSNACAGAWLWERLTMLDTNNNLIPGVADTWEVAEDGVTWTFHLNPEVVWSDGSPLVAGDFEYALKRQMDPKTGSSWGWFYYDIKNGEKVNSGELPPDELGIKATDEHTLVITTESKAPYLPMLMAFPSSAPVPQKVVEELGMAWSTDPATCLTNSSYKLAEWNKGQNMVLVLNPNYKGRYPGSVEKIIATFGTAQNLFPAYQADEIDGIHPDIDLSTLLTTADLKVIEKDPRLSRELYKFPFLGVEYMFFPNRPPYDNVKVRQAFAHAIDRDQIISVAFGGLGLPAYGMLPPGMPGYQAGALDEVQSYNPELAKQLLAEAGYPDGNGFPEEEFWLREPDQMHKTAAEMIQSMLKQNLGVNVKIVPQEKKVFLDVMAKHEMPLAVATWMYDYVDPSDFLNAVWQTGRGRHDWVNEDFNKLVSDALAFPDAQKRIEMYEEANKILSEDAGGAFLYYTTHVQMWKPYVKGLAQDSTGFMSVPYYYLGMQNLYIAQH